MPQRRHRAIGLALLCAAGAHAQGSGEPGSAGDAPSLDTVTVNARRSIEQRFLAPGSMVVVDRRDIENLGAFSVADVLRQLPGVVVTTSGDGSVEIRMRGMDRNATQILVDGQRTANGRSQLALDQLPPEVLERIEVVRAPSAEFSGATGGTINIVLRQATAKRETSVRVTDNHVWGHNMAQSFLSQTGPVGRAPAKPASGEPAPTPAWSYFVALSDIGYLLGSDVQRSVSELGRRTDTDARTRYRREDLSLIPRFTGRLGPADQLTLRGTFVRANNGGRYEATGQSTGAAGPFFPFASAEDYRFERHYLQGAADWAHRFATMKLDASLNTSRASEGIQRNGGTRALDGSFPASTYSFDDRRRETLATLQGKLTGTQAALLWSAGGELEHRNLDVVNTFGATRSDLNAVLDRAVLWGQNEWEVWNGSTLTAGLRGETLNTTSTSSTLLLADRRSSFLQPSVHLRKPLSDTLQFRANVARITRNPRIWDLIDRTIVSQGGNSLTNPDHAGNPNLRPETSWTLDTGMETRLARDGQAGLNLFVRRTTDTIGTLSTLTGGRWVEQRVNLGDATAWGLEADVKSGLAWAGLPRDWTLAAHATLLQSEITSGPLSGARIPGQPRYTANVTVARPVRRSGGWFGGATLGVVGSSDLDTAPGVGGHEKPRAQFDAYVGSVVRGLGYWRVGVYNITDAPFDRERHYADAAGGPAATASHMLLTPRIYLTLGTEF